MARVVCTLNHVFAAAGNLLYRFSTSTFQFEAVNLQEYSDKLPKIAKPRADQLNIEAGAAEEAAETSAEFRYLCLATSSIQSLLAVGTSHKTVLLIDTNDLTLTRAFRIPKAPTCITFDEDGLFVIIGDRSGHVCRYSVEAPATVEGHKDITGELCQFEGEPLMGAISMVLDVAISSDNRYLFIADRDEKVRIHRYPDAYVIESIGLGHAHYVSSIAIFDDRIFSTGGDSTIKEWSVTGKELRSISVAEDKPIKKICVFGKKIFVLVENSQDLLIYNLTSKDTLIIEGDSELLDICEINGEVFAVSRKGLVTFPSLTVALNQHTPADLVEQLNKAKEPIAHYFKNVTHNNMEDYHKRKQEKMNKGKEKKQRKRKNKSLSKEGVKKTPAC